MLNIRSVCFNSQLLSCLVVLFTSVNTGDAMSYNTVMRNLTGPNRADLSFDQLVTSGMFVDKSLFIAEFLNSKFRINVITRPHKWGKSVNMDMLQRFLEIEVNEYGIHKKISQRKNHIIFDGGNYPLTENSTMLVRPLNIVQHEEIMKQSGMSPVLLLRFSNVRGNSYKEVESKLKNEIKNLFSSHSYLKVYLGKDSFMLNSTEKAKLKKYFSNQNLTLNELHNGLLFISRLLYEHYLTRIMILVDDKDLPLHHAVESFGDRGSETRQVLILLENIFKGITDNIYMKKCLITGTLPFTEDAIFLNSSKVCVSCVLDERYSQHYGFSEQEVDTLLQHKLPNLMLSGKMKQWYKGWHFGTHMLYNPYDIMSFVINKGFIHDYWIDVSHVRSMDEFLIYDEAQVDLLMLLEDEGTVKFMGKRDNPDEGEGQHLFFGIFYRLMVHHGYLNAFNLTDGGDEYLLRIPNQEVRNLFADFRTQWFCNKYDVLAGDLHKLYKSLATCRLDEFGETLRHIFRFANLKNTTLNDGKDYHMFMSEILHGLLDHNFVFSGKHFELGRLYHMIIPRSEFQGNLGFVIEYNLLADLSTRTDLSRQLQSLAQHTLDHINCNVYGPILLKYTYVDKVSTVAVTFHKMELEVAYREFSQDEPILC